MPGLYTGTGKFEFDERFFPCVVDEGSLAAADPRREIDDDDVVTAIASMILKNQCRFSLSFDGLQGERKSKERTAARPERGKVT